MCSLSFMDLYIQFLPQFEEVFNCYFLNKPSSYPPLLLGYPLL